ncbi:hypothetical protein HOY80DRAFT_959685 [Tuber brumale]|nr:hypothetical protein HOY80DRAFT_959685 [Tuber brumale]
MGIRTGTGYSLPMAILLFGCLTQELKQVLKVDSTELEQQRTSTLFAQAKKTLSSKQFQAVIPCGLRTCISNTVWRYSYRRALQ